MENVKKVEVKTVATTGATGAGAKTTEQVKLKNEKVLKKLDRQGIFALAWSEIDLLCEAHSLEQIGTKTQRGLSPRKLAELNSNINNSLELLKKKVLNSQEVIDLKEDLKKVRLDKKEIINKYSTLVNWQNKEALNKKSIAFAMAKDDSLEVRVLEDSKILIKEQLEKAEAEKELIQDWCRQEAKRRLGLI